MAVSTCPSVGLNLWVKSVGARCTPPRNKTIAAHAPIRIRGIIVRLLGHTLKAPGRSRSAPLQRSLSAAALSGSTTYRRILASTRGFTNGAASRYGHFSRTEAVQCVAHAFPLGSEFAHESR